MRVIAGEARGLPLRTPSPGVCSTQRRMRGYATTLLCNVRPVNLSRLGFCKGSASPAQSPRTGAPRAFGLKVANCRGAHSTERRGAFFRKRDSRFINRSCMFTVVVAMSDARSSLSQGRRSFPHDRESWLSSTLWTECTGSIVLGAESCPAGTQQLFSK
jgi:hypothetical protein